MRLRNLPAPYVTAALGLLAIVMAAGWGYEAGGADALRTARLERTRARMVDGTCLFTTAFRLHGVASRLVFARHQQEIRDAIVGLMRTKSRYMVQTEAARQGLAVQVRNLANYTVDGAIADGVSFPEFAVY